MLGRSPNCDIVLNQPEVSGQHCQLVLDENEWFIKDLVSLRVIMFNLIFISNCWTPSIVNICFFTLFRAPTEHGWDRKKSSKTEYEYLKMEIQ